jgi:hypothetical protein
MGPRKDPRFIEDEKRIGVDVNPLGGAEIGDIIRDFNTADPAEIESLLIILS